MPTQPAKTGLAPVTVAGPGVMRAIVQDVYGSADRHLEDGRAQGKIAITV